MNEFQTNRRISRAPRSGRRPSSPRSFLARKKRAAEAASCREGVCTCEIPSSARETRPQEADDDEAAPLSVAIATRACTACSHPSIQSVKLSVELRNAFVKRRNGGGGIQERLRRPPRQSARGRRLPYSERNLRAVLDAARPNEALGKRHHLPCRHANTLRGLLQPLSLHPKQTRARGKRRQARKERQGEAAHLDAPRRVGGCASPLLTFTKCEKINLLVSFRVIKSIQIGRRDSGSRFRGIRRNSACGGRALGGTVCPFSDASSFSVRNSKTNLSSGTFGVKS